jgi:hypothetical protein
MLVVDAVRVISVCVVGGVVVDAVVLESPGFHMLKVQNVGSVIFMDSGPVWQKNRFGLNKLNLFLIYLFHTAKFCTT